MVVGTRSQTPVTALEHVLDVLNDSDYLLIFREVGISDITGFKIITVEDLKDASAVGTTSLITLNSVQVRKVEWIQRWFLDNVDENSPLSTWFELTPEVLQNYMMTGGARSRPPSTVSTDGSSISTKSTQRKLLYGVKRDINAYPILREDKHWMMFNRTLNSLAATHAVEEVLDTTYVEVEGDKDEFKGKNTFMFSVFSRSLITPKAKVCLRSHEANKDAQAVYKDLLAAYSDGTVATLNAESLEEQLRNMKLDKSWNKKIETFLHTWSSRLHDLEIIRDDEVSQADKRRWLINSIKGHEALYQGVNTAKSVEQAMKGMSGYSSMTWDQFFAVLLDHAQILDSNTVKKTTRAANNSNTRSNGGNNKSRGGNQGKNWIPFEKWKEMTPAQRKEAVKKRQEAAQQRKAQKSQQQQNSSNSSPPTTTTSHTTVNNANQTQTVTFAEDTVLPPATNSHATSVAAQAQRLVNQASQQPPSAPSSVTWNGVTYHAHVTNIRYHINSTQARNTPCGSLIDRGANGGLSGNDVRVLETSTTQFADVTGIAGASVKKAPLCTVAGVLQTQKGPIIGIFHQYAHYGEGNTLHSPLQLGDLGLEVDDHPKQLGLGKQQITTPEGFVIPLSMKEGLMYMDMAPPSDEELDLYPHVTMTKDTPWDPSIYDEDADLEVIDDDTQEDGESEEWDLNAMVTKCVIACHRTDMVVYTPKCVLPKKPDFSALRPVFGWIPAQRVKDTILCTTQYYKAEGRLPMRRHYRSRFPGANVPRRDETVATDTIFSDTPALDDGIGGHGGCTMLQFYVGCTSAYAAGFPMVSEKQVPQTLQDFIRNYGAPNALFSDNAKSEISKAVQDILRHFALKHYRSEPHQQNQNPAERRIQDIKKHTNVLLDRTGAPATMWLLCMLYVIDLHNHLAGPGLDHKTTPIYKAFGFIPDISKFLQFHWWQRVLYKVDSVTFPSSSYEGIGRFVGIANHVGDVLTYHILTDDTQQVIARSMVRSLDPANPNIRVLHPEIKGEENEDTAMPVVHSLAEALEVEPEYDPEKT